jgi:hypothetical protein
MMLAIGIGTDAVPGDFTWQGELSELESVQLIFKDDGTIWTAGG